MVVAFMPKRNTDSSAQGEVLQKRAAPCFVILDTDCKISGADPRLDRFLEGVHLAQRPPERLPALVERAVRHLIGTAFEGGSQLGEAAVPAPNLLVRACVLKGPDGACVAVTLEQLRERDPLGSAAVTYRLTRREHEVLSLILEGLEACEIASRLGIATHTVGDYFKNLYRKIGVNNRSAMLARVFQWQEKHS